jgi:ubiquinone/menaquinone biosynthesis C-methylase UbiE
MAPKPATQTSYGQYILTTGDGIVGQIEMVWGRFFYESRFRGKRPIADVGPGRCWFTRQNAADIVAIDNAPDVVEHYSRQLRITLGSAQAIPFPDAYFEGVFCCWLFEHLPDPVPAIREFHRVLKPGGLCSIVVPTPADMEAFYADYTHIRPFTPTSLRQLAAVAPFARVRIGNLPWARGLRHVHRAFGQAASYGYLRFADRYLRHAGLHNRAHLVMDAWK